MNGSVLGILCGGLGILVLFGIGVGSIIFGIRNRKKAEASNAWPSADGMITNAWIEENTDVDDDGYSSTTYTPKWEYQFQISGTTYTSDRISYGAVKGYGRRKKAQEELVKFPTNSRVRVYYDPANPAESVLIRGTKGTMLGIILGIIVILISIIVACVGGIALLTNM